MGRDWISRIRKGDVLRSRNGVLRVVRAVSHTRRTTVTFVIRRCSWTTRCYTIYTGNDLRQMGYAPTNVRMPLRTKFDRLIEAEFHRPGPANVCFLHCCDVTGIS